MILFLQFWSFFGIGEESFCLRLNSMGSGFCKPTTTHITWHPTITISLCFTNVYLIHFKFEFEIISYRKFYKVIDLNWKLFLITISEECLINLALLGKLSLIGHKLLRNVICRYKFETNMLVIDRLQIRWRLGLLRIGLIEVRALPLGLAGKSSVHK